MVFPVDGCSSLGLSSSLTVIDTDDEKSKSNNNNNNRLLEETSLVFDALSGGKK